MRKGLDIDAINPGSNVRESTTPVVRFGGKSRAAPLIWRLLGPVDTYVDPCCGGVSVPLKCPYRLRRVVINDRDSLVANFWRSVQFDPEAVAWWADYPTIHDDLIARREWLRQVWPAIRGGMQLDPWLYDPQVAGVWVWAVSNSIDLLKLELPNSEERAAYWAAVNALRGDATRRPNLRPDGYASGVSAQRQGLQGVVRERLFMEDLLDAMDGLPAANRDVPAVVLRGGRGLKAQRGLSDGRQPTIGQRSGRGVNAQRTNGYESTEHDWNVRPHLAPQGVNAQRGGFSTRRPLITQRGGVGVQAHRDGVTSWRSEQGDYVPRFKPDYPAPPCSCHLPPDVLIDNDALPFDGGRLAPWIGDLCRQIYRWNVLNRDWSMVVNSKSITGLVPSNTNTVCGIFLDPPYDEGESRDLLYSDDSYETAEDVRRWLYTEPVDRHGNPTGPAPCSTRGCGLYSRVTQPILTPCLMPGCTPGNAAAAWKLRGSRAGTRHVKKSFLPIPLALPSTSPKPCNGNCSRRIIRK